MNQKPRLTLEQHKLWGARVYRLHAEAIDLAVTASRLFPKRARVSVLAHNARAAIDAFRSELDNEYYTADGTGNSPYYTDPDKT